MRSGSILSSTLGDLATVIGLNHAAERPVRYPDSPRADAMMGGSPRRSAAAELEGELNLLDFGLTRLGLPDTIIQRPPPRRLTTTGRLTSS